MNLSSGSSNGKVRPFVRNGKNERICTIAPAEGTMNARRGDIKAVLGIQ